jgi:hypothetical protein
MLVFHAYINEKYGSRSKIASKNLVRQRCADGFNSSLKRLQELTPPELSYRVRKDSFFSTRKRTRVIKCRYISLPCCIEFFLTFFGGYLILSGPCLKGFAYEYSVL